MKIAEIIKQNQLVKEEQVKEVSERKEIEEKVRKRILVYQSNALTESRYQFDLVEKRLLYTIIVSCRELHLRNKKARELEEAFNDKDKGKVELPKETELPDTKKAGERAVKVTQTLFQDMVLNIPLELIKKTDASLSRVYLSAEKLGGKKITINDNNTWLTVGFINYAKHNKATETLEVGVSKEILPYLCEQTEKFTCYELTVAIVLKSTYTQRLYELCSQWKRKGTFFMKMDNLRAILSCEEKYPAFGEFNRAVLNIAQVELKELYDDGIGDLYFTWEILEKDGKTIKAIEFKVHTKENTNTPLFSLNDLLFYIDVEIKQAFPKDKDFVTRIKAAAAKDFEVAEKLIEKIKAKKEYYPRSEFPPILRYILREDFGIV